VTADHILQLNFIDSDSQAIYFIQSTYRQNISFNMNFNKV